MAHLLRHTMIKARPSMPSRRRLMGAVAGAVALTGLSAGLASAAQPAQAFDGPLRILVGYAPGGATDHVARIVGDRLAARLGVPVIVENK